MDAKTDIIEREKITVARCEKSSIPCPDEGFPQETKPVELTPRGLAQPYQPVARVYRATPTASVLLFQRPSTARSLPVTPPTPTPIKGQQRTHSNDSIVVTAEGEYSQDDRIIIQVRY